MDMIHKLIKVRDVVEGYYDNQEGGVKGLNGKLDIRPPYQREFVYKDDKRTKVLETVASGFPLNTMYWVEKPDGTYEVLDGQQRTISIAEYIHGTFSINNDYFHSKTKEEQEKFYNYELSVYICKGSQKEVLDWFKVINIAGEKLTNQELRNSVYTGPWLSDAKKYFSKTGGAAYNTGGKDYVNGSANRQDYLETVIKWKTNTTIEEFMSEHQHKPNANNLRDYWTSVMSWIKETFPVYRREMKGVDWGMLYKYAQENPFNSKDIDKKVKELMEDWEVSKKQGIYAYLVTGKDKYLSMRTFNSKDKREVYEKQERKCKLCKVEFEINEMEADHITPWSQGGKTETKNCQMLCKECNRRKSDK